jgi:hypothetical protein
MELAEAEAPESGGAPMAEDGAVAAGQHGCKPLGLRPDVGAERVDAAMEADQPAVALSPHDLTTGEAEVLQLRDGHDAVLPSGDRVQISTHTVLR